MSNIFEGILVVDFTNNVAGPTAASMLADYGAQVIKIEKPGIGDDNRGYGPFIEGKSITAMYLNRGKKSIVLETRKQEAIEIVKEFISKADVVIDSFRPGTMKKLGLAYEDLIKIKPDIIMCSISGYGQTGPYWQKPGYDLIAQALSGMMSVTGTPDGPSLKVGTAIGDWTGGLNAFAAISAALYHRARTGEGQSIDISLLDCLVIPNEYCEPAWNGFPVQRSGNHHSLIAPFGLYEGRNGAMIIGAVSDKLWADLCHLMGKDELINDPLYDNAGKRAKLNKIVVPMVENWVKSFETIDEVRDLLESKGIPCAKVNEMSDLINDPQLIAREMITDLKTTEVSAGKIKARGIPLKFSKTPGKITFSPALGEHTEEVLREVLGYSAEKIAEIKKIGILG